MRESITLKSLIKLKEYLEAEVVPRAVSEIRDDLMMDCNSVKIGLASLKEDKLIDEVIVDTRKVKKYKWRR